MTLGARSLRRADFVWLGLLVLAVFAEALRLSWGRQLWSDELFGWMLVRDPSLPHMLSAWRSGADGGGILFYLMARLWSALCGPSVLAFRLLNAVGMAASLVLTWIVARRWYRLEIVAFSIPFCWFTAHSVLAQMPVGRFYGLLMAAAALAVFCYTETLDQARVRPLWLVATCAAHCLLAGIHPFGALYSAAILLATLALDAAARRFRPWLYAAALGGWWILIPSRAAMAASAAVGKPHFWTITPVFTDLLDGLFFWTDELAGVWLFLLVCFIAHRIWLRRHPRPTLQDRPARLLGTVFLAILPLLWLVSQCGTSYFVDRYLTPTLIGAALLQCAVLERLIPRQRSAKWNRALVAATAVVGCVSLWGALWDTPGYFAVPPHQYTAHLDALLPPGLPVVVERVDVFTEASKAQPELPLRFLLDWETVLLPESPRGDVSGYHEMENWHRAGYDAGQVEDSATFLAREPDFIVLADPAELWFARRIEQNPAFTIAKLGQFRREHDVETIWRVHRIR